MSYQGQYNGSDSEAEDFWLNNPSLANLAGASTTSVSVASTRLIGGWERIVHRLLRLRFIQEGVCNCRPIPAELSKESVA